jgi:hypothetical protein
MGLEPLSPTSSESEPRRRPPAAGLQGGVIRVDAAGNQTIVAEGGNFRGGPLGIALAPSDDLFLVTSAAVGSPLVLRVDPTQPAASNQTIITQGGFLTFPTDIALARFPSEDLFVVDTRCCVGQRGGVIRAVAAGTRRLWPRGGTSPSPWASPSCRRKLHERRFPERPRSRS